MAGQIKSHHKGTSYWYFLSDIEMRQKVKKKIKIDEKNDDSLGTDFYEINKLEKKNLSKIAIMEIEKLGYKLKNLNFTQYTSTRIPITTQP